ncbi:hypothetical protein ACFE04_017604 [Oxalis oulophora]
MLLIAVYIKAGVYDIGQVESHKRAAAATASDKFKDEIIPVSMKALRGGAKINFKGIFGAIEGLAASLIQVPTEVVKQRMQTGQFNSAPNVVHRYIVFVYLYDLVMMHHNVAGVYKYGNSIVVENIDSTS